MHHRTSQVYIAPSAMSNPPRRSPAVLGLHQLTPRANCSAQLTCTLFVPLAHFVHSSPHSLVLHPSNPSVSVLTCHSITPSHHHPTHPFSLFSLYRGCATTLMFGNGGTICYLPYDRSWRAPLTRFCRPDTVSALPPASGPLSNSAPQHQDVQALRCMISLQQGPRTQFTRASLKQHQTRCQDPYRQREDLNRQDVALAKLQAKSKMSRPQSSRSICLSRRLKPLELEHPVHDRTARTQRSPLGNFPYLSHDFYQCPEVRDREHALVCAQLTADSRPRLVVPEPSV
ncbi:hypothetical protein B0H19DRAFT_1137544 [Mycena capillaripes]|nr:hypothetical protein B0H19DRAFT_1137544 [Mycena capillaripes]